MAKFNAKSFNERVFGAYMSAVPNLKFNKLRASRAVVRDVRLREAFKNNSQTGAVYATLPFFGLLGGNAQNYDGVSTLTPTSTQTFEQGVFTYGRMNGWTEADFSYDVTGGTDFMENVRNQINTYWSNVDQEVLLSILKGIFLMSNTGTSTIKAANKAFVDSHTYDIGQGSADVKTTDDMKVNATTLNSATQQACGDNKNRFSLVICHSAVATNLENLNLLQYLKYTDSNGIERDLSLGTWNGRLVLIDDSMPVENKNVGGTGGNISLYTTYILGEGAISLEDVGAKVPYEMLRDAKTHGGEDTLISRKRNAVAVAGISYQKATQATNSPTNAELETGNNWSLVNDGTKCIDHKAVPIARIISRG